MATRLAVEWTRGSVRVAVAEGGGSRWRLRSVRSQPMPSGADVAAALRSLAAASAVGSAEEVIGVLPREQVITRIVRFPSTDAAEIAQMAELYAKAQLPYTRDQAVVDSRVLRQEQGFSTVALVACQRDLAERHLAVLRDAGLSCAAVTVSSWGVLAWCLGAVLAHAAPEPVLIVNIDDTRTDFVLIAGRRLLASRSIAQGAHEWQGLSETAELLVTEVERTRGTLRKELPGTEARSLILTGLGALAQWREPVAQRLGLPVTVIEAAQAVEIPVEGVPISPVAVAGVAVSEPGGVVNLSPSEARTQLRQHRQLREFAMVGGMLAGAVVLGAALLGLGVLRDQRMAGRLDHAVKTLEPKARQVRDRGRSVQLVRALFDERRRFAATLAGIFRATPPPVTLEALTVEQARREIVLRGIAASTQTVLDYIQQLERLEGVEAVELKYSTSRSTSSGERTDFELVLRPRGVPS
ncbi:MAG: pilus assembly protein PilM [Candidatus Omnitrophica bacterium]|nr:pilus assembly protein PilM [Candidatus Omnitrophota bacterium]